MAGRVARPNTLVLQCPEQIASMSEDDFMSELFKSSPRTVVRACQFLPKNYVRVTFKDEASRDLALVKGVSVRGFHLNVFEADPKAALVYCYWIPVEVSTDSVRHALPAYGQVLECQRQVHSAFPDIESGVRLVRIKLTSQIPEVIRVLNFPCKIYYRGQPKSCRSCKKTGHQAKDCPYKDKCFRCGSADHLARSCTNAWNVDPPVAPPVPDPVPPAAPAASSSHLTAAPSASRPPPLAPVPPATGSASGAVAAPGVPVTAPQQQPPASQQDSLVAGLHLVPDSQVAFSGMPPLEELPHGVSASSSSGALDQDGFLVTHPPQSDVSVPNPALLSSGASAHPSSSSLINVSLGSSISYLGSNISNVGGQKSSTSNNYSSHSGSVGQVGPPLSYSGAVSQIPIAHPPNSNLPNSVQIPVQNSAPNSVSNSSGHSSGSASGSQNSASYSAPSSVSNSGGSTSGGPITPSNSVALVDDEMGSADDSPLSSTELSPDEFRALKKLLSPANVKRISMGRLPGDAGFKSKGKKHK